MTQSIQKNQTLSSSSVAGYHLGGPFMSLKGQRHRPSGDVITGYILQNLRRHMQSIWLLQPSYILQHHLFVSSSLTTPLSQSFILLIIYADCSCLIYAYVYAMYPVVQLAIVLQPCKGSKCISTCMYVFNIDHDLTLTKMYSYTIIIHHD